jgi:hypothetical protein
MSRGLERNTRLLSTLRRWYVQDLLAEIEEAKKKCDGVSSFVLGLIDRKQTACTEIRLNQ